MKDNWEYGLSKVDEGFVTITGKQARKGQFETRVFGPTDERLSDSDAVQENYYQQRGFPDNQEGITASLDKSADLI